MDLTHSTLGCGDRSLQVQPRDLPATDGATLSAFEQAPQAADPYRMAPAPNNSDLQGQYLVMVQSRCMGLGLPIGLP